ncbi:hypothetical protein [Peribacillus frigoritolerans]|uniref:hypothetical protein n=1 Tax=Peribacillus frigoritolerans TaxID=450367 RepID=UPI00399F87FA
MIEKIIKLVPRWVFIFHSSISNLFGVLIGLYILFSPFPDPEDWLKMVYCFFQGMLSLYTALFYQKIKKLTKENCVT